MLTLRNILFALAALFFFLAAVGVGPWTPHVGSASAAITLTPIGLLFLTFALWLRPNK